MVNSCSSHTMLEGLLLCNGAVSEKIPQNLIPLLWKMGDSYSSHTMLEILRLCNGAVSEKIPQILSLYCALGKLCCL